MADMDVTELGGLIIAASTLATVLTTFLAKWIEERRERILQTAEVEVKVEEVEHISIERAAEVLERHADRLDKLLERERDRRERAEAALEAARYACPVGQDNCPIKRAAEKKKREES